MARGYGPPGGPLEPSPVGHAGAPYARPMRPQGGAFRVSMVHNDVDMVVYHSTQRCTHPVQAFAMTPNMKSTMLERFDLSGVRFTNVQTPVFSPPPVSLALGPYKIASSPSSRADTPQPHTPARMHLHCNPWPFTPTSIQPPLIFPLNTDNDPHSAPLFRPLPPPISDVERRGTT